MKQVWSIGQRKFAGDFKRRIWMFDHLIKSILMYGAEIWGWKEYGTIERCQDKFIKWTLGLDWNTPSYMVREETKRQLLRIEAGKRAVKFEEKIREKSENKIMKECLREIERDKEDRNRWKEDREMYFRRNGMSGIEVKRLRDGEYEVINELIERDIENQRQIQQNRIQNSRYNTRYKKLITRGTPEYLRKQGKKDFQKVIARFRCGNEERRNKFWREQEKNKCRFCQNEAETLEHIAYNCVMETRDNTRMYKILEEKGEGISWMKKINRIRKEKTK